MTQLHAASRSTRLTGALAALLGATPELEAAAVVTFDGLPMASALPASMDEDRVAAMSAALLSLGERAAEGLGRGGLSQVYVEGESGTVFLVSADDEAVLVAVAARGAKIGMMLYEVKRAAAAVAEVLRADEPALPEPTRTPLTYAEPASCEPVLSEPVHSEPVHSEPVHSEPVHSEPVPHDAYTPAPFTPASFLPAAPPLEAAPAPRVPEQVGPGLYGPVPEALWSAPGAHALPGEPSAWS